MVASITKAGPRCANTRPPAPGQGELARTQGKGYIAPGSLRREENEMRLTKDERDALYRAVVLDLSGVGDMESLLEGDCGGEAREYRQRFQDDWALLDAIGWEADDEREHFELIPDQRVTRALRWLEGEATGSLQDNAEALREPYHPLYGTPEDFEAELQSRRGWADENLDLRSACRRALGAV
jgi:hypothetical protein